MFRRKSKNLLYFLTENDVEVSYFYSIPLKSKEKGRYFIETAEKPRNVISCQINLIS